MEVIDVPSTSGSIRATSTSKSTSTSTSGSNLSHPIVSNDSITPTTLALAVALPVLFLLSVFAFIFFYGVRRRGWFLPATKREQRKAESEELMEVPHDKTGVITQTQEAEPRRGEERWEVDGQGQRYQAGGTAIHQLVGDEEWRSNRYH